MAHDSLCSCFSDHLQYHLLPRLSILKNNHFFRICIQRKTGGFPVIINWVVQVGQSAYSSGSDSAALCKTFNTIFLNPRALSHMNVL